MPDRRARVGAGENDVRHFAAAQRLGRLLAEHPADGVEHVRFAAPIRPDDARSRRGGNSSIGLRGEGLEAEEFERLEIHERGKIGALSVRSIASGGFSGKHYSEWVRIFPGTRYCGWVG